MRLIADVYNSIRTYQPIDPNYPVALFGAVVDRTYGNREGRAYEQVLHKFDEMLRRQSRSIGQRQVGLVIHDKRSIERDVQSAAQTWRLVSGRMGTLGHLADVPLFADSRASRLIQAADFISWSLWRHYGLPTPDSQWMTPLLPLFDRGSGGAIDGLIHVSPAFQTGCLCPPCVSRRPSSAPPAGAPGAAAHV